MTADAPFPFGHRLMSLNVESAVFGFAVPTCRIFMRGLLVKALRIRDSILVMLHCWR